MLELMEISVVQLINLHALRNFHAKAISSTEIALQWTDPNIDLYNNHPTEMIRSLVQERKYVIR